MMTRGVVTLFWIGIAVSGYSQVDVPFEEFRIQCLNLSDLPDEMTISNQSGYEKLLLAPSRHPDCKSYRLPRIDFEKKWLLGFHIRTGGCTDPNIVKRVIVTGDEVLFSVSVSDPGMCKSLYEKMLWVLIDRPLNKRIKFELKKV